MSCTHDTPIEEALIQCFAFMDREHLLPEAVVLYQRQFDELANALGSKFERDENGQHVIYFEKIFGDGRRVIIKRGDK